jgi:hypothetical protein
MNYQLNIRGVLYHDERIKAIITFANILGLAGTGQIKKEEQKCSSKKMFTDASYLLEELKAAGFHKYSVA